MEISNNPIHLTEGKAPETAEDENLAKKVNLTIIPSHIALLP